MSERPTRQQLDEQYMAHALQLARRAEALGEVPVGCVVVHNGVVVGEGLNGPIGETDPSAHAEIRALRMAGRVLNNYRMPDCDMYVTLEPCLMCAGAIIHARLGRLVFGATDPKTGAAGGAFDVLNSDRHNHRVRVESGVLGDECSTILSEFFKRRREQQRASRKPLDQ